MKPHSPRFGYRCSKDQVQTWNKNNPLKSMVNTINQLEFAIKNIFKRLARSLLLPKVLLKTSIFKKILFISSIAKTNFRKLVNEW